MLRKLQETNVFCRKSKMILRVVETHRESSESRHSWGKTQDVQCIKYVASKQTGELGILTWAKRDMDDQC